MPSGGHTGLVVLSVLAALLAGCKPENKFIEPPPAEVSVAVPLEQKITPYIELTGNTQAFNNVDLVARVEGFLQTIDYIDGDMKKKGELLFQIDPTTYQAQVKQAQAQVDSAKATYAQAEAEFNRQETLLRQNVSAQNTYDQAKAKRDTAAANIQNQEGALTIAQTNLDYTRVTAPFDGIVTNHLVSVGELVGSGTPTKLATIVQLNPIYVYFTMSEQQLLDIRQKLPQPKDQPRDWIKTVPIEIGLMTEEGFPHKGHLDYASPNVDANTGTILIRGIFDNPTAGLLPGFFVRVHLPTQLGDTTMMLVPDRAIGEDQAGKYVMVVNKDNVVEQRPVKTGILLTGGLRVITSGLKTDDRVVVTTNGQAVPGRKVVPKTTTLQPSPQ